MNKDVPKFRRPVRPGQFDGRKPRGASHRENLVANIVPTIGRVIAEAKIAYRLAITAYCRSVALLQEAHEYPCRQDDRGRRSDRFLDV
jgi:hypothetical protein